jgi:hypothetical protein
MSYEQLKIKESHGRSLCWIRLIHLLKHINEGGFGSKNNLFVYNITWLGKGVFTYEKPSYN